MSEIQSDLSATDGKLSLDDVPSIIEEFKPRVRELYHKVDPEITQEAKEIGIEVLTAVLMRGSRSLVRMILDKLESALQ